jgi:hypothetical protein
MFSVSCTQQRIDVVHMVTIGHTIGVCSTKDISFALKNVLSSFKLQIISSCLRRVASIICCLLLREFNSEFSTLHELTEFKRDSKIVMSSFKPSISAIEILPKQLHVQLHIPTYFQCIMGELIFL